MLTHKVTTSGALGRPAGVALGAAYDVTYAYDVAGRLNQVAWNVAGISDQVTYARVADSELLGSATYGSGVQTTYGYEPKRDLKTQVKNVAGGATVSQYDYQYDAIGRRRSVANSGSAFAQTAFSRWNYNDRNELTESGRYLGADVTQTSAPVADEYRAYNFDPIGNRTSASEGAEQKSYQANLLNEYTTAAGAVLSYEADGNLTNDGSRRFAYDAENRLVLVEPVTASDGAVRVRMVYDYMGRRVQKVVEEFDGSAWAAQDDVRFVYVGWNVIEERHASAGVTTKKNFVRGLDLSQSMSGAGGVGGLLAVADEAGTQMAFLYDANGNVGQLVDEQGGIVARYEYAAFGNVLVADGVASDENAWRFSTKYAEQETGLVRYEHRYYMPSLGRWVTRDPIGEKGGVNLFAFVNNAPTDAIDYLGLYRILVRIDVPGQNPSGPGDHEDMVIDDTDTGHAWMVFDPECGKGTLSVGWYPARAPFMGSDYHNGVSGQLGDDSKHHYEYEYAVEKVSEEKYEAALRTALSARGSWSEKNSCTNFVIEMTRAAGIDLPATWQTYNPNFVIGPVTFVFPGRLAKDLHAAGKGRYKSGGSAGRPADGSSGKGLGHDPHTSPPLPAGLRNQWFPKPAEQVNEKQCLPAQPQAPSPGTP